MPKRSLQVFVGVVCLSLLAAGMALAQGGGDPERGGELYAENCAVCHGPTGEGRVGAELNDVFAGIDVDEFLRQTISEGRPGTFMPTWGQENGGPLSEQDIDDIIAYIETWGSGTVPVATPQHPPAEDIPPVPEVDGDPNLGAIVFAENCVACHGESGEGRIGETLAKEFSGVEPGAYVISVVTEGIENTLMPPWGMENGGPLTEDDVQNVAAYVLSLQPVGTSPGEGDQVQPVSGLPLAILAGAVVVILIALGVATQRRSQGE